jgi:hypothetical protein
MSYKVSVYPTMCHVPCQLVCMCAYCTLITDLHVLLSNCHHFNYILVLFYHLTVSLLYCFITICVCVYVYIYVYVYVCIYIYVCIMV